MDLEQTLGDSEIIQNRKTSFSRACQRALDSPRLERIIEYSKKREIEGEKKYKKHWKKLSQKVAKLKKNISSLNLEKLDDLEKYFVESQELGFKQSASFVLTNHRVINYNSLPRAELIKDRHGTDKANHIVETLPSVLSYSLERTRGIYSELDGKGIDSSTYVLEHIGIFLISPDQIRTLPMPELQKKVNHYNSMLETANNPKIKI